MADAPPTPAVHGTPNPSPHVHPGIKGFMTTETAGMPNWVWLIVIGGGIAAAYFIPKLLGSKTSSSTTGADTSGLGLAVDPTTGLPYAVEGLVPAGGTVGDTGTGTIPPIQPPPTPTCNTGYTFQSGQLGEPIPQGSYAVAGGYCVPTTTGGPPPSTSHLPGTTFLGPTGVNHYVSTGKQSLSQLAQMLGLKSWNSLYAIPENQDMFGKMNATDAAKYVPPLGMNVVIPQGITGPPWPGS